jgi:hypothetical protein
MKIPFLLFLACITAPAICNAQSSDRATPNADNPTCMDRDVDSNSPACLADRGRNAGSMFIRQPASQATGVPAGEINPATGLKAAPSLPPGGNTPVAPAASSSRGY